MKKINIFIKIISVVLCMPSSLCATEATLEQRPLLNKGQTDEIFLDEINKEIQNSLDFMDTKQWSLRLADEVIQKRKPAGFKKEGTPNEPYDPFWKHSAIAYWLNHSVFPRGEDSFFRKVFKESRLEGMSFKNPNAYKLFGPIESYIYIVCRELRNAFQEKIKAVETALKDFDHYYDLFKDESIQKFNGDIAKENKAIEESKQKLKSIEERMKDEKNQETLEEIQLEKYQPEIKLEMSKLTLERYLKYLFDFNNKIDLRKDQIKEDLERKLEILKLLMEELTEINTFNVRFIDKRPQSKIMHFPKESEQPSNHEAVIVLDAFTVDKRLPHSDLEHPVLENFILPGAKNEQVRCMDSHACHVTGIIHDLAPFSYVIPKPWYMTKDKEKTVREILSQDYGAKVINVSSDIEPGQLKELCKKHIVIVALGNTSNRGDDKIMQALRESDDVRKHLLVVISTMPDGQTISPSSSFPGGDDYPAVAAPGQWIRSTIPTPKKDVLETTWAKYLAEGAVPPADEGGYEWYKELSGTSQAAPAVTAAVLWVISRFPTLSLEEVVSTIKDSANHEGELSNKKLFGYGLVDVQNALKLAEERVESR